MGYSTMNDIIVLLPPSVRIGAFDYRIETVDKLEGDLGQDAWGLYSPAKLLIQFERNHPDRFNAIDSVLHEINHAIYGIYALSRGDNEERIVSVMATGWTQVLRDNPDLVKWIVQALET